MVVITMRGYGIKYLIVHNHAQLMVTTLNNIAIIMHGLVQKEQGLFIMQDIACKHRCKQEFDSTSSTDSFIKNIMIDKIVFLELTRCSLKGFFQK